MLYDVIVIGAGASGLYFAAHLPPCKCLIVEKNRRFGAKVLVSGGGQCNLTHAGKAYALSAHYGNQKKYVKKALKAHDNQAVMAFFESVGVPLLTRPDGKVFPKSLSASDVVDALVSRIQATTVTGESVLSCTLRGDCYAVKTDKTTYLTKRVVVASGGVTYPQLGATGVGYDIAKAFGHSVVPPRPALAAVYTEDALLKALQGLVVEVALTHEGRGRTYEGTLLFTHFGISGPVVINHSASFAPGDKLTIRFVEDAFETLESNFITCAEVSGHHPVAYFLNGLAVPDGIKQLALKFSGLNGDEKLAAISKQHRKALVKALAAYPVSIERLSGLKQAMVTAGGVSTKDVDSKTFESTLQPGLYFIGEVLDVDGETGGYNLQWAFASAHASALAVRAKFMEKEAD